MDKCDFCLYSSECIGEIPGEDGLCLGFAVPKELQSAYKTWLEEVQQDV